MQRPEDKSQRGPREQDREDRAAPDPDEEGSSSSPEDRSVPAPKEKE
jgi:hypothetical protein